MRLSCALLVLLAGCGHIEYGTSTRAQMVVRPAATVAPVWLAQPAPPPGVVYVPWDPGAQTAPRVAPPAPPPPPVVADAAPAWGNAPVQCSGNQHIRVAEQVLDGQGGPAIIATGGCVVEVSESILRGEPAVLVSGSARVYLVECRIDGDLRSAGGGQIETRGSRHERGNVTRF